MITVHRRSYDPYLITKTKIDIIDKDHFKSKIFNNLIWRISEVVLAMADILFQLLYKTRNITYPKYILSVENNLLQLFSLNALK